jgi:hypothetical protein
MQLRIISFHKRADGTVRNRQQERSLLTARNKTEFKAIIGREMTLMGHVERTEKKIDQLFFFFFFRISILKFDRKR